MFVPIFIASLEPFFSGIEPVILLPLTQAVLSFSICAAVAFPGVWLSKVGAVMVPPVVYPEGIVNVSPAFRA